MINRLILILVVLFLVTGCIARKHYWEDFVPGDAATDVPGSDGRMADGVAGDIPLADTPRLEDQKSEILLDVIDLTDAEPVDVPKDIPEPKDETGEELADVEEIPDTIEDSEEMDAGDADTIEIAPEICAPSACDDFPGECGEMANGCGGFMQCVCLDNQTCDEGTCICKFAPCAQTCCAEDQVCDGDEVCCTPDCEGKDCGDDGCGETCWTGEADECDDGNPCTGDSCQDGLCNHDLLDLTELKEQELTVQDCLCEEDDECDALENDNFCDGTLYCVQPEDADEGDPKVCQVDPLTVVSCADEDWCDGQETCLPQDGSCQDGEAPVVADDVDCTIDYCDEENETILHKPDHDFCDDGNNCTTNTCNPETGCETGTVDEEIPCGDFAWCQTGQCVCQFLECGQTCCPESAVCFPAEACCLPDCAGQECGDGGCGNPLQCGGCDPNEVCSDEGLCECPNEVCSESCCNAGQVCDLDDACCLPDCDGVTCGDDGCGGLCDTCDDGNVCTDDFCDIGLGCQFTSLPDGTVCQEFPPHVCTEDKCICEQTSVPIVWDKLFGEEGNAELGYDMQMLPDGGMALLGSAIMPDGPYDMWLVVTDSDGNVTLDKTYNLIDNYYSNAIDRTLMGISLAVLNDGFAMYGHSGYSGENDAWLVGVDSDGVPLPWSPKQYDYKKKDHGRGISSFGDGTFALVGYTRDDDGGPVEPWLLRTDPAIDDSTPPDGGLVWQFDTSNLDGVFNSVQVLENENLVVAAGYQILPEGNRPWLVVVNGVDGGVVFNQTYDMAENNPGIATGVVATSSGYAIAGNATDEFGQDGGLLAFINLEGEMVWHRVYGDAGRQSVTGVIHIPGEGYRLSGHYKHDTSSETPYQAWIVATDESGMQLWDRKSPGEGASSFAALGALGNGGLVGFGWDNHQSDFRLVRFDEPYCGCTPDCTGRKCGDDGCGGVCSECGDGEFCDTSGDLWQCTCQPQCDGKACGDDFCGGTCGDCPEGQSCFAGQCTECWDGNDVDWDGCNDGVAVETQVNVWTEEAQQNADVAVLSDGGYVIVWESLGQDGNNWGVYGRHYDSAGDPGLPFQIHTYAPGPQLGGAVVGLGDGGYAIAYSSTTGLDGSGPTILLQRFDALDNPVGEVTQVNTSNPEKMASARIANLASGNFVVSWKTQAQEFKPETSGLAFQRFNSNGQPLGDEEQVTGEFAVPWSEGHDIAGNGDGNFMTVWHSNELEQPETHEILAQLLNSSGNKIGSSSKVDTTSGIYTQYPSVDRLSDGGLAVVWRSSFSTLIDGKGVGEEILARLFDGSGASVGNDFVINSIHPYEQRQPAVAGLASGGFVVGWHGTKMDENGWDVYARRFDADGTPIDPDDFFLSEERAGTQAGVALASFDDGRFVATWYSKGQAGDDKAIFHRIFSANGMPLAKACGDGICTSSETCGNCPQDCGDCPAPCGDGLCWPAESPCTCPADCGGPCEGRQCGDDGCGNSCGECDAGFACSAGYCLLEEAGKYVRIPAGTFMMGSPEDETGHIDLEFQHKVSLSHPLLFKQTEVTQKEWADLMDNTQPSFFGVSGESPECIDDDCPVESINWYEAISYCNSLSKAEGLPECYQLSGCAGNIGLGCGSEVWCMNNFVCEKVILGDLNCLGYRLPTEAEWEFAARAGTQTGIAHPLPDGGDIVEYGGCNTEPDLDSYAWYCDNSGKIPHPVQGKNPNNWNLYDMSGNISEMVWDSQDSDYFMTSGAMTNPVGPEGDWKSIRGGYYADYARECRSAARIGEWAYVANKYTGFRPVRTLCQPQCNGRSCGEDGCGGSCGTCGEQVCLDGDCVPPSTECNDGNDVDWDGCTGGYVTEFRVNPDEGTEHDQQVPSVAARSDGGFVVGWRRWYLLQGTTTVDAFGAVFDATGKILHHFQVNDDNSGCHNMPSVASFSDKKFVVACDGRPYPGAKHSDIFAQVFDQAANKQGDLIPVNTVTAHSQARSMVIVLSATKFVVLWQSANYGFNQDYDVRYRRFNIDGTALDSDELHLAEYLDNNQGTPVADVFLSGHFAAAWESIGQDGDSYGVFARLFDASGQPKTAEFQVPANGAGAQLSSAVATGLPEGRFVTLWTDLGDDDNYTIQARICEPDASSCNSQSTITGPSKTQITVPSVDALPNGFLVASWKSTDKGGGWNTWFTLNSSDALPVTQEIRANSYSLGDQGHTYPDRSIAALPDGRFVIVWESCPDKSQLPISGQDGDGCGIFARLFSPDGQPMWGTCGDGVCDDTDSNDSCPKDCPVCGDGFCDPEHAEDECACPADCGDPCQGMECGESVCGIPCGDWNGECEFDYQVCINGQCPDNPAWECDDGNTGPWDGCTGGKVSEWLVNAWTPGDRYIPRADQLPNGNVIVVWTERPDLDSDRDIFATVLNADMDKVVEDFRVNTLTEHEQYTPDVVALENGGFVVAWTSMAEGNGQYGDIRARRFNADGSAKDVQEFMVNTTTYYYQDSAILTSFSDSSFLVVWTHQLEDGQNTGEIRSRWFNADGSVKKEEFVVNANTNGFQGEAAVATLDSDSDRFTVFWHSSHVLDSPTKVFPYRRYFSNLGQPENGDLQVSQDLQDDTRFQGLASLPDKGVHVATWHRHMGGLIVPVGRSFSSFGQPLCDDLLLDGSGQSNCYHPEVAIASGGIWLAAWESRPLPEDSVPSRVAAQVVNSQCELVGDNVIVNTLVKGSNHLPSVIALEDGTFLVLWAGSQPDEDHRNIFAQRLSNKGKKLWR
jgi:formylglycine-generating enzyme required for sulfatase activity